LLLGGLGILGIFAYRKRSQYFRTYIFFTAWFLLGFLTHIQIIPLDGTVADRWFYFYMAGLLGILGMVAQQFNKKKYTMPATLIALVILLILGIKTITRNAEWSTPTQLYRHDLSIN